MNESKKPNVFDAVIKLTVLEVLEDLLARTPTDDGVFKREDVYVSIKELTFKVTKEFEEAKKHSAFFHKEGMEKSEGKTK